MSRKHKGLRALLITAVLSSVTLYQSGCSGPTNASADADSITDATLSANASNINFGNVPIGDSNTVTLSFTNTTASAVTILSISISGQGFNASGIPTGTILNPGQTATLSVSFTAEAVGSEIGSVTATSNAPSSVITVGLQATGVPDHLAMLSWNASASPVNGYYVYRGTTSGGPYTRLNASEDTSLSYTDSAVTAGQTYYYVVTAVDSNNVESSYSNQVAATIPTP